MITKFGCKNIKAIKDFDSIEIKPITIIMGENSSGKSSMLQALSLLNVNKTFGNSIQKIKYDNPFSEFGDNNSFKDKGENLIFEFEISEKRSNITLTYADDKDNNQYGILQRVDIKSNDLELYLELYNKEYKVNIEYINIDTDINIQQFNIFTDLKVIVDINYISEVVDKSFIDTLNKAKKLAQEILKPIYF